MANQRSLMPKRRPAVTRLFKFSRVAAPALGITLCLCSSAVRAQAGEADIVRGVVTDTSGRPVKSADVRIVIDGSNLVRAARSDDKGQYAMVLPANGWAAGVIVARAVGYGPAERIVQRPAEASGVTVRVDFTMHPAHVLETTRVETTRRLRAERLAGTSADPGASTSDFWGLSTVNGSLIGDLATAISTLSGYNQANGGFSVLGLDPAANGMTIGGLSFSGTSLPRAVTLNVRAMTTSYDPSRGGFSGGLAAMSVFSAAVTSRKLNATLEHPNVAWGSATSESRSTSPLSQILGGELGDALPHGAGSYSLAFDVSRRRYGYGGMAASDSLELNRLGLSTDVVAELRRDAATRSLTSESVPDRADLMGSAFLTLNVLPTATSWLGLTASASHTRSDGNGWLPTADAATGARARQSSAWVSAYFQRYVWNSVLNSLTVGGSRECSRGNPYLAMPSASVAVRSLVDGDSVPRTVWLGGSTSPPEQSDDWNVQLRDDLSWMSLDGKHRLTVMGNVELRGYRARSSDNALGVFSFNSLSDFGADSPSSFRRTLNGDAYRDNRQVRAAMSAGDRWAVTDRLQLQYGVRVDAERMTDRPPAFPAADSAFGIRTGFPIRSLNLSPRFGFTKGYGSIPQALRYRPGESGPRGILSGGVGVFQSNLPVRLLDALAAGRGVRELHCVGGAVPRISWNLYRADTSAIPSRCDGDSLGGSGIMAPTATVVTFDPSYSPSRSLRANAAWRYRLAKTLDAGADVTVSRTRALPDDVDENFDGVAKFVLAGEQRPVYVRPDEIVSGTGAFTFASSRLHGAYGAVRRRVSDAQTAGWQGTLLLRKSSGSLDRVVTLGYTFQRSADLHRGFYRIGEGDDPRNSVWTPNPYDRQHQFKISGTVLLRRNVVLSFHTYLTSGVPFTPRVSGDVNGDGAANDRAFIFDPASISDSSFAAQFRNLMADGSGLAKRCLAAQLGRLASVNSCRGGWTGGLNVSATHTPALISSRLTVTATLYNAAGLMDLALHGAERAHGWGEARPVDPVLLVVRGFDQTRQRFQYDVNPRFGTVGGVTGLRNPARLVLQASLNVGPDREAEAMRRILYVEEPETRRTHRADRGELADRLAPRPPYALTLLANQSDRLGLTEPQQDSIYAIRTTVSAQSAKLIEEMAREVTRQEKPLGDRQIMDRIKKTLDAVATLNDSAILAARALLTPDQMKALPDFVRIELDPAVARARMNQLVER